MTRAQAGGGSGGRALVDSVISGSAPLAPDPRPEHVRELVRVGLGGLAAVEHPEWAGRLAPRERAALDAQRLHVGLRTLLLHEEAHATAALLRGAGISVVALKGAAMLEAGIYTEPGARYMTDTDLLVPLAEAPHALTRLRQAGYTAWAPAEASMTGWLDAATFTSPRSQAGVHLTVDLHWRVGRGALRFGEAGLETELLARGQDTALPTPPVEPHLVHLAEHYLRHLRVVTHRPGLADLVRLCPRVRDWSRVSSLARQGPLARGTAALLAALRLHYGASVPPGVPSAVDAVGAREWAALHVLPDTPGPRGRLGGVARRWRWAGGGASAAGELLSTALPRWPWLAARYPELPRGLRLPVFWAHCGAWAAGLTSSPASPNQRWEPSPLADFAERFQWRRSAVDTPEGRK